jgi:hypothetical protein
VIVLTWNETVALELLRIAVERAYEDDLTLPEIAAEYGLTMTDLKHVVSALDKMQGSARHDSSDYLAAQRAALTARGMSPDEVERAMHPVMSFLASASDSGEYIDGCHCDRCTIARMREALIDIRDNWDHDGDAHKYGTPCRCCTAEKALS